MGNLMTEVSGLVRALSSKSSMPEARERRRLIMQNRHSSLIPCTALGCMELLTRSEIDLRGKEVVLMGDSNVVGTPLAMLLRTSGIAALTLCRLAIPLSAD